MSDPAEERPVLRLTALWQRSRALDGLGAAVFLLLVGLAIVLIEWAGYPAHTTYPWSSPILLDAGYRVVEGQVPHVDFHTPIGYGYCWLLGQVMRLGGVSAQGIVHLSVLLALLLAIPAVLVVRRRLPSLAAWLVAAFIVLHVLAISMFGAINVNGISYAGHYSRVGWAVFLLLAIQCLIPMAGRPEGWPSALRSAAVAGLLVAVLFAIKITFAAAGILGLVIAALVWWPGRRLPYLLGVAGGFLLGIVLFGVISGLWPAAYLADILAAKASSDDSVRGLVIDKLFDIDIYQISLALLAIVVAGITPRESTEENQAVRRTLVVALLILPLGLGLSAVNGSELVSPVYALIALIVLGGLYRPGERLPTQGTLIVALIALVFLGAGSVRMLRPMLSNAKAALQAGPPLFNDGVMAGDRLVFVGRRAADHADCFPTLTIDDRIYNAQAYQLSLRAGLDLLAGHAPGRPGVQTLDITNPWPPLLGAPAPRGGQLYWHFGRNVAEDTAPPFAEAFAEVDVILVPKRPILLDSSQRMQAHYAPDISRHFERRAENEWWILWQRTADNASLHQTSLSIRD